MQISREVKVSDDNYGNTTHRLQFEIHVEDLATVHSLLDDWEAILRASNKALSYSEDMSVRELKAYEEQRARLQAVCNSLATYSKEAI